MDLHKVFAELREIMLPYARKLKCTSDREDELSLETEYLLENRKPLWFGAVQNKKNYVSYHLMPVYVNPGLLAHISPELKKRMQGKSCFNFSSSDAALFEELKELTEAAYQDYKDRGYV